MVTALGLELLLLMTAMALKMDNFEAFGPSTVITTIMPTIL